MPPGSPIAVSVQSRTRPLPLRAVIRRALSAAARAENVPPGLSVSATDVLSFGAGDRPGEAGAGGILGDIVLSLDHLRAQAATAGHSLERETAVLTVHGFLHLLGYDHAAPEEERLMFGRADRIVAGLGLPG